LIIHKKFIDFGVLLNSFLNTSSTRPGNVLETSWKIASPGNVLESSWKIASPENVLESSWKLQGVMEIAWMPWKYPGGVLENT
jgi:hypothetical protein